MFRSNYKFEKLWHDDPCIGEHRNKKEVFFKKTYGFIARYVAEENAGECAITHVKVWKQAKNGVFHYYGKAYYECGKVYWRLVK